MPDTKYLIQRRQTWYVNVKVPVKLQKILGKAVIVETLGTRSLPEAQTLRYAALARIKGQFEALEKGENLNVLQTALSRRQALVTADASPAPEDPDTMLPSARDDLHDTIVEEAIELETTKGPQAAATFFRVATSTSPLLGDTLDAWLKEAERTITKQTAGQYRSDAERFIEWAKKAGVVMLSEVTKRFVGRYVSEGFEGLTPKTINRHISSLSMWWRWLERKGFVEVNPWSGQSLPTKQKKGGAQVTRRQYTTQEITKLLMGLEARPLGYLFRLGLFSGARLDELASLKVADVVEREDGLWLSIREGKTENAVRTIPVHSCIKPMVERMVKEALATKRNEEGWLFPGLTPGGPDEKRSWNVSKKFTRERRKLEVDDPATVFHSTRKNLIEALEAAEVPLHTAKLLVGHERGDMTYGRYSKGEMVNLRAALEKVQYPKEVMDAL